MHDRDRLTDVGGELVTTSRGSGEGQTGGMGLTGTATIHKINTRNTLHSAGNYSCHLIITYNGV